MASTKWVLYMLLAFVSLLSLVSAHPAAPAITTPPSWEAVRNAPGAALPDPHYHPSLDISTCTTCVYTTSESTFVTLADGRQTSVLHLRVITPVATTTSSPPLATNSDLDLFLREEYDHESANCLSSYHAFDGKTYDMPVPCAPGLRVRPTPTPRPMTPHRIYDWDENLPNPYRLTGIPDAEKVKYSSYTNNTYNKMRCFPRPPSRGRHQSVDLEVIEKAAYRHCAEAAQQYGVKNGAIQFPASNIAEYLEFNKGWQTHTFFHDIERRYVQVSIRQGFKMQPPAVLPISERTCRTFIVNTARFKGNGLFGCADVGDEGSGVSIYQGIIVTEVSARYLTPAESPQDPVYLPALARAHAVPTAVHLSGNSTATTSRTTNQHKHKYPSSTRAHYTGTKTITLWSPEFSTFMLDAQGPVIIVGDPNVRMPIYTSGANYEAARHWASHVHIPIDALHPTVVAASPTPTPMAKWSPQWLESTLRELDVTIIPLLDVPMPTYQMELQNHQELERLVEWTAAMLERFRLDPEEVSQWRIPIREDIRIYSPVPTRGYMQPSADEVHKHIRKVHVLSFFERYGKTVPEEYKHVLGDE